MTKMNQCVGYHGIRILVCRVMVQCVGWMISLLCETCEFAKNFSSNKKRWAFLKFSSAELFHILWIIACMCWLLGICENCCFVIGFIDCCESLLCRQSGIVIVKHVNLKKVVAALYSFDSMPP